MIDLVDLYLVLIYGVERMFIACVCCLWQYGYSLVSTIQPSALCAHESFNAQVRHGDWTPGISIR